VVLPPGADGVAPRLNSCAGSPGLADALRCSGHGRCADWFDDGELDTGLSEHHAVFCACDRDWADPECSTPRRSQAQAFALSMFLGPFGADLIYLGYWWPCVLLKFLTLGGFGVWWAYDLVRIGSTPVFTATSFRLAPDLPHWVFTLAVIVFTISLGFGISFWSLRRQRIQKAYQKLLLQCHSPDTTAAPGPSAASSAPAPPAPMFRGPPGRLPGEMPPLPPLAPSMAPTALGFAATAAAASTPPSSRRVSFSQMSSRPPSASGDFYMRKLHPSRVQSAV